MTRSDRSTSRYRTQRPAGVDAAAQGIAAGLMADIDRFQAGTGSQERDPAERVSANWNVSTAADLPESPVEWARKITAVAASASIARHYRGSYINPHTYLTPGDVVVIANGRTQQLTVYIFLPDNVWYKTPHPPVVWRDGWGRILRGFITGWVALTRVERILRACSEATAELTQIIETEDQTQAIYASAQTARAHFEQIAAVVADEPHDLTGDAVLRSFDAWIAQIMAFTHSSEEDIREALSLAIEQRDQSEEPEPEQEPVQPRTLHIPELVRLADALDRAQASTQSVEAATAANDLDAAETAVAVAASREERLHYAIAQARRAIAAQNAVTYSEQIRARLCYRWAYVRECDVPRRVKAVFNRAVRISRQLSGSRSRRLLGVRVHDDIYYAISPDDNSVVTAARADGTEVSLSTLVDTVSTQERPAQQAGARLARNIRISRRRTTDNE